MRVHERCSEELQSGETDYVFVDVGLVCRSGAVEGDWGEPC